MQNDLEVADYSAKQIKLAVVGYGQADKEQVQHMVRTLLGLNRVPSSDAADALAVAICHANQFRI
jgi:crossover junction endodeoxyribonuclease RuvC